jgi:hypothetical protein
MLGLLFYPAEGGDTFQQNIIEQHYNAEDNS